MTDQRHTERRNLVVVLCGRDLIRTRVLSPRQLPTDHDYAVPTREYQSDQPSLSPLSVTGSDALQKQSAFPLVEEGRRERKTPD